VSVKILQYYDSFLESSGKLIIKNNFRK